MVIATWNLENLFRPNPDFGPKTQASYRAKLEALAAVIDRLAPDVLAVQELGDAEALDDLAELLAGDWHAASSTVFEHPHTIRVGFLAGRAFSHVEQIERFPERLAPLQVDDDGTTIDAMPRGALRARVTAEGHQFDLISCHLKSKLLSFPGGHFSTDDEGERARYAAYALDRRAAEAATVRAAADVLLAGHGDERAVIVLGISTTSRSRRPRRSCSARPALRSAPRASSGPTAATRCACGTSRR
jgi:hypothetical protein